MERGSSEINQMLSDPMCLFSSFLGAVLFNLFNLATFSCMLFSQTKLQEILVII